MSSKKRRWLKRIIQTLLALFVLLNVLAAIHAYQFTHFSAAAAKRSSDPLEMSVGEKAKTLLLGVNNPRPVNVQLPDTSYEHVIIASPDSLACWWIKVPDARGTVILFHGYAGEKSSLLARAKAFRRLGYHTLLVDFTGAGGSAGNSTSIGFFEAGQVAACMRFVQSKNSDPIVLFGTSMGAAAILKAVGEYRLDPSGIVLECPFGSMYKTVAARFKLMGAPTFPMAGLLVFWGGVINGFWAFGHNPAEYAYQVKCPTLLMYGSKDNRVSREEIDSIFNHLAGKKMLKLYEEAGHDLFPSSLRQRWQADVATFLQTL